MLESNEQSETDLDPNYPSLAWLVRILHVSNHGANSAGYLLLDGENFGLCEKVGEPIYWWCSELDTELTDCQLRQKKTVLEQVSCVKLEAVRTLMTIQNPTMLGRIQGMLFASSPHVAIRFAARNVFQQQARLFEHPHQSVQISLRVINN